jgi:predicted dehydrogenase
MINTAIVGLGWWGQTLVKAVRDFGAPLNITRAVTLEPETVGDYASEHGLRIDTSFEKVLADPDIKAVILATPHTRHRAQVEAAAAAGKHIYCEKPFALSRPANAPASSLPSATISA